MKNNKVVTQNKLEDRILYINAKKMNIKKMQLTDVMIIDNYSENKTKMVLSRTV